MPSLMGLRSVLEIMVAAAACAGWWAHHRSRRRLADELQQRERITRIQQAAIEAMLPPDPRRRRRCAMAAELGRLMGLSAFDQASLLSAALLRDAEAARLIRGPLPGSLSSAVRPRLDEHKASDIPGVELGSSRSVPERILSALDAYDSLRSGLPGGVTRDRHEMARQLQKNAGGALDPRVVSLLVTHLDRLESFGAEADRAPAGSADPESTPQTIPYGAEDDPLTRLPHARLLFGSFDQEIERALRDGAPLSLLELDINHFGVINERFGRLAGDRILRGVARAIRSQLRPGDTCVRYASDLFLVSVPGVGAPGIDAVKARIEMAIGRHKFAVARGQSIRIGISLGAASFPDDGRGYDALIAAAGARRLQQKTTLRSSASHPILMLRYAGRSNVPVN